MQSPSSLGKSLLLRKVEGKRRRGKPAARGMLAAGLISEAIGIAVGRPEGPTWGQIILEKVCVGLLGGSTDLIAYTRRTTMKFARVTVPKKHTSVM